ncbi:MAG: alkene reductase [Pseudomonadota bacterium]|nr:alkene reductase [Pseudomonadota bacterium]
MTTQPLFTSHDLAGLALQNRIALAPMTRSRAGEGNVPTELAATYYAQRASAGLLITEATQVAPEGQGYVATPGIYSPEQEAGWRAVVDAVRAANADARIYAQLWHVGRVSHTSFQPGGKAPVSASAVPLEGLTWTSVGQVPFSPPRALEIDEIPGVVAQYVQGARVAKAAGFDGIELHAANGYLIDQFLRDGTNHRTDAYGGSIANRLRFLEEVVDAVTAVFPAARVGVRVSPSGTFNGMSDSAPEALFAAVAQALAERGIGYLHAIDPEASPTRFSALLRANFPGTYIVNGGFTQASGNAAIASGEADLVAYGVPFLANPDLPRRFAEGAALNPPDFTTFYAGGAKGYTDYPTLP